jgi:rRNA maturation protein Nop10
MDEYQTEYGPCPHCGNATLHFRHCHEIGCEDGYIDEYDEDPINYSPGEELRQCEECHGTGIQRWCPACGKDVILDAKDE